VNSLPLNSPDRNYKTLISIYALVDPETEQVRYIGKSLHPESRFNAHMHDHTRSQKGDWIQGLIKRGLVPEMRIVEEVPRDQGEMREIYWMNYYKEQGHSITNVINNQSGERAQPKPFDTNSFAHRSQIARRTFYSSMQSDRDIDTIKHRYGLSSDSDVIRFSLRLLASTDTQLELRVVKKVNKTKGNQQELF